MPHPDTLCREEVESGWRPIETAPKDGSRFRVGHFLDPSSMGEGRYFRTMAHFEDGSWFCSAGFVCVDGVLRFRPTHWLPADGGSDHA